MKKDWTTYFPEGFTAYPHQRTLIQQIQNAFDSGKKFVICCAPTGSGKSFLAKTLEGVADAPTAKFTELVNTFQAYRQDFLGAYSFADECLAEPPAGAMVLTITKALQDQYAEQFSDTSTLKGKSNYTCDVDNSFTVETAPCVFLPLLREDCWRDHRCPYYEARNKSITAKFAVLNYKMFLALPAHVKKKNIIVCDEASELEDELVKQFSVHVDYAKLKFAGVTCQPLISEDPTKARTWIADLIQLTSTRLAALTLKLGKNISYITSSDKNKITYLRNLNNSLRMLDSVWLQTEFIIELSADQASFTPLTVDALSHNIFAHSDKILLMSATIIDHKNFAKCLGIKDYEYIEAPSTFDPKKSPIYISSKHKLNYKTLKTALPLIADQVKLIVKHHKADKGIIHTHTQSICTFLKEHLHDDYRFLYRDQRDTNEKILEEHYTTDDPTVLVSPSMTHGIDLRDDLARFQIIVKLPFLPLNQKRIKRLFDNDAQWYENKMLNALVQASGRATRNDADHCITYILDGTIMDVLSRAKHKLPKHFVDRFI